MANYTEARAAIATIIEAVTITAPAEVGIKTVYMGRPDAGAYGDDPCVHLTGYTLRYLRGPGGTRERQYTIGMRLFVRPVPLYDTSMQDVLDALKDAISEAFDTKITLDIGGGFSVVEGPNWTSEEPTADGGGLWDEGEIIVLLSDASTFIGGG